MSEPSKQMAIGMLNHEGANKFLPVGGWCAVRLVIRTWGMAKRSLAVGRTTPFIHRGDRTSRAWGAGPSNDSKELVFMKRDQTPVGIYDCPTRRPAIAYPIQIGTRITPREIPVAAKDGLRNERWRCRNCDYDTGLANCTNPTQTVLEHRRALAYDNGNSNRDNPMPNPPLENGL